MVHFFGTQMGYRKNFGTVRPLSVTFLKNFITETQLYFQKNKTYVLSIILEKCLQRLLFGKFSPQQQQKQQQQLVPFLDLLSQVKMSNFLTMGKKNLYPLQSNINFENVCHNSQDTPFFVYASHGALGPPLAHV